MRILFDKNVPVGVRGFLAGHEVRTVVEMGWPQQLENGELLNTAEMATFDVMLPRIRTSGISKTSPTENSPLWGEIVSLERPKSGRELL